METLSSAYLYQHLKNHIPRILSQLDRDADSPTFGSFDRNYWHYKIRDFSSMILQQGMLILQAIKNYDNPDNPWFENRNVDLWQEGAVKFWCKEQLKNGSFNEYYPFEAGYPPTAFSLYAIGLIMREYEKEPCDQLKTHIQKAVKWLLDHPEKEALNQEARTCRLGAGVKGTGSKCEPKSPGRPAEMVLCAANRRGLVPGIRWPGYGIPHCYHRLPVGYL